MSGIINTNIKEFIKGKFAVNCKTKKEAKQLLKQCHSRGIKWANNESLVEKIRWLYEEDTIYIVGSVNSTGLRKEKMYYGSVDSTTNNLPIIEFSKLKTNNKYKRVD